MAKAKTAKKPVKKEKNPTGYDQGSRIKAALKVVSGHVRAFSTAYSTFILFLLLLLVF